MIDGGARLPQSIGELLDRGVRLYLRRFAPLFVPVAVVALLVLALTLTFDPVPRFDVFVRALFPQQVFAAAGFEPLVPWPAHLAKIAVMSLAAIFEASIAIVLVHGVLTGAMPTLRAAVCRALARLLITAGVTVLLGLIALIIGAGVLIVIAVPLVIASRLIGPIGTVGLAVAYALAIGAGIVLLAFVQLAWFLSLVMVLTESTGLLTAFEGGWSETFARGGLRRSFGAGLTIVAIGIGAAVAGDATGGLIELVPGMNLVSNVPTTISDIITCGLQTTFAVLYRDDLQARRAALASP
jgi:hypothetical protein